MHPLLRGHQPSKGEESILASRAECKISQDTMGRESLPLLSGNAELSIQTLETMSRRRQLGSFGRCTSPNTKEEKGRLRLKERLLVAKEGTGTTKGRTERKEAERESRTERARG